MGILGKPIAILDVANAEAFVQRCIDASQIRYSTEEREDLLAEGLTILYELADRYRPLPARPGIDEQGGRFSGYAAMFLPRRLGDAWHKWHPEHRYITNPETGKRGWYYDHAAVSLDGLNDANRNQNGTEHHLSNARTLNSFCHDATLALLGRTASSVA